MTIKAISAILTTKELELITEDGTSVTLPQGHPQIATIVEKVLPVTTVG